MLCYTFVYVFVPHLYGGVQCRIVMYIVVRRRAVSYIFFELWFQRGGSQRLKSSNTPKGSALGFDFHALYRSSLARRERTSPKTLKLNIFENGTFSAFSGADFLLILARCSSAELLSA